MAEETKIEEKAVPAAEGAKPVPSKTEKAPVTAAAEAVKAVAKPVAAKTAPKARRARKVSAKVAAPKKIKRVVKKAPRAAKAATAAAATPFERINPMTNDFTQLFAGFQLPGSDKFNGLFADAGARGQELAAKGQATTQELADIAKANLEALAEAGRIAATGAKSIGQDVLASSRDGLEQASDAVKTLADAKSPTEFFQLQSELVRSSFDRFVSESSKLTEQVVKLAGEAIQPISNRASVNAERVNELMA